MVPKRTIEEIRQRLKHEKDIREVYVEGLYDRDFLKWAFAKLGLPDVRFYPIATVDVPVELLEAAHLTSGERQRLIAAAMQFEADAELHDRVLFFIDADFDHLNRRANYSPPLRATVHSCLDLVLWKAQVLKKFTSLALGRDLPDDRLSELIEKAEVITRQLFIFRAAKEQTVKHWVNLDAHDALDRNGEFDFSTYCTRTADKNAGRRELEQVVLPMIAALSAQAEPLPATTVMNGHDAIAILCKLLKSAGFNELFLQRPEEAARLLLSSVEWEHVKDDPNFEHVSGPFRQDQPQAQAR